MVSEHIYRDWTGHNEETIRPENEYAKVEIYSYDHQYTKTYHPSNYSFKGLNQEKVNHRHLTCLKSDNDVEHFTVELDYNCLSTGEYKIDIFYENMNSQDYIGRYDILSPSEERYKYSQTAFAKSVDINIFNQKIKIDGIAPKQINQPLIQGENINFDGEPNILKTNTIYENFKVEGKYTLYIDVPVNCYFIGVIIRKIKLFTADSLDSSDTNMSLGECECVFSNMVDPAEASFEILYSQSFDCDLTKSGFYMDYMDEVNIYFREDDKSSGEIVRRFGGYISSVTLNDDRTRMQFNCGDRLQDGESKYILDSLLILYGTTDNKDAEWYNPINFNSYGQALKYLCDIFGNTLNSNIGKNYLVQGEVYSQGLAIKFGKQKDIKKVTTQNATAKVNNNNITLRNNASSKKQQTITLYNEHGQIPFNITSHLTFNMTYGLGATKTTKKIKTTEYVDNSVNSAGAQKFSKCGVSKDKKYLMAIGLPSNGKDTKKGWTKKIFENKCPHCGKASLVWDIYWNGQKSSAMARTKCTGKVEGGNLEGHVFCKSCDADFSVQGHDHGSSKTLTGVSSIVSSSKAEALKLKQGKMVAVPKSNVKVSPEEVLKAVASIAKKYTYSRRSSTTYSAMKKSGKGDCHAFSDLIYTELSKYGVSCRICEYKTSLSSTHRSVIYKDANNKWVNFPYKKYGLNKILYPTSAINVNSYIANNKGSNIATVTTKASNSSKQTSTITETNGYDKDKPIQGYIQIKYSTEPSWSAKTKNINLDFTQKAGTNDDLSGLSNVWVNNATRQTSVDMSDWFADNEPNKNIYLHSIKFIAPKIVPVTDDEGKVTYEDWYTYDKSTHDNSSCKMDIYSIIFDDGSALNPTDLQSCGKSINEMLKDIVEQSGYLVNMSYENHRCDDRINFKVDNRTEIAFEAKEGDDNNILEWSNITYAPVSDLKNKSICVFKDSNSKYKYVDTADIESILRYGEKATLVTVSEQISSKEAYFNARNSDEYNPEEIYSYTILVPYAPKLNIGDLVSIVSNYKKLNDVKTVESIKISYNPNQIPRIRTEIGLDELEPYLRIRKEQEALRKQTRSDKTYFARTATPVENPEIYTWEN